MITQNKFIFLRHGQTQENLNGRYHGRSNAPLNETGQRQIRKASETLKNMGSFITLSSPLQRCRDCCEILKENVPKMQRHDIIFEDDLMEFDFGIFEGLNYKEMKEKYPEETRKWQHEWRDFCIPEGEGIPQIYHRVSGFLQKIQRQFPGCNFLMVTHWGVIQAALAYLLHNSIEGFWKYELKNGGLTVISYSEDGNILNSLNT
jgi:alpha-ribazole phosphatase